MVEKKQPGRKSPELNAASAANTQATIANTETSNTASSVATINADTITMETLAQAEKELGDLIVKKRQLERNLVG